MALHIPRAPGFSSMLKDGARYYEGLEEAVFRNIEACIGISKTTKSTYGPHGQSKIVINHIGKQFVTNDAATILRELEVNHPAAKLLFLATQQQEQEAGDGTNLVFQLAGSFLSRASELIKMGLTVTQVADGFELALEKSLAILNVSTLPEKNYFNVDNIRILKIAGSGVLSSSMIKGLAFRREAEGDVKEAKNCKVAVFSCPFDALHTETKGTVLIHTAKELTDLSKGEEEQMMKKVKALVDAGIKVVFSGGKVGELALHYANKLGLMIVRLSSKFDVRRIGQLTKSTVLPTFTCPTPEECGFISHVYCKSIADTDVVIVEQSDQEGDLVTLMLRGSSDSIMDDIERCIDDGVNTFKCLTRCNKVVVGAGATEVELSRRLMDHADTIPGLEQYAVREYARAFEIVPKSLAENAGMKSTETIAQLYGKHQIGDEKAGIVAVLGRDPLLIDAWNANIVDIHAVKEWAIKFATTAACTVLRVDQIIMAKPAGGPKPRDPKAMDDDD